MAKYAMVIDLNKCMGCGSCAMACKTENNTRNSTSDSSFNWADYFIKSGGTFPKVDYTFLPVLCNHCTDAPCIEGCPTTPKSLYKSPEGVTIHVEETCIGCQACQNNCPYSVKDISRDNSQYSVISYNEDGDETYPTYADATELIKDCTASGAVIAAAAGSVPPNWNEYEHTDYNSVRAQNKVEKCMMCDHRLQDDKNPYCVDRCPAGARIQGDMDDPSSEVAILLAANTAKQLKNNEGEFLGASDPGTSPNVYYIGEFSTEKA